MATTTHRGCSLLATALLAAASFSATGCAARRGVESAGTSQRGIPQSEAAGTSRTDAAAPRPPAPPDPLKAAFIDGEASLLRGDRTTAGIAFARALTLAEALGDRAATARALAGLGDAQDPLRENAKALAYYQQSLEQSAGRAQDLVRARIQFTEGVALRAQYHWAEAQARMEEAIAIAKTVGDAALERRFHVGLGNVFMLQSLWDPAEREYLAAIALYDAKAPSSGLIIATEKLGDVADGRGDTAKAAAYFERAVALARPLGDANILAEALTSLGGIYLDRADYARAHELLEEALAANPSHRDEVGNALSDLGLVASLQGQSELAEDYYRRARAASEEAGHGYDVARETSNLASLLLSRGDFAGALATFQQAMALSQEAGDPEAVAGELRGIGRAREAMGQAAEARDAYQRSIELAREKDLRKEVAAGLEAQAGLALGQGQNAAALDLGDQAAALAVEIDLPELYWSSRTVAGRALAALGKVDEARGAFEDAILAIEGVRELSGSLGRDFFAQRLLPYQRLLELEAQAGNLPAAVGIAEAARARMLLDRMRQGGAAGTGQLGEAEAKEGLLRETLAKRNQELFLARQKGGADTALAPLQAAVERARLDLQAFRAGAESHPPEVRDVSRSLPDLEAVRSSATLAGPETLVLLFAVLPERTYLFTLTPGREGREPAIRVAAIAAGEAELGRTVADLQERLARRDPGFADLSRTIYNLLLAPVERELQGASRVVLVPDGPLWNLPFQALQDGSGGYLLEHHALSYAPSLAVLRELRKSEAAPPVAKASTPLASTLLAVGNPSIGAAGKAAPAQLRGRTLAPLPEAEEEVHALGSLYQSGKGQVLTGAEATESRVKSSAGGFKILHFATHGVLESGNPLYSYLVLAQGTGEAGEDGLLEAWEILGLHLEADLVVLAGCETARGAVGSGEGLIGLTWAFLAAGSRSVVASQWEVDSAATRTFMLKFHGRLLAGGSRAEALQRAARDLAAMPQYRHPFYWAGFLLVGDGAGALTPKARASGQR
jgi:CHAT domain-containing protein/tetratricopeptide (TPR) repeat protein